MATHVAYVEGVEIARHRTADENAAPAFRAASMTCLEVLWCEYYGDAKKDWKMCKGKNNKSGRPYWDEDYFMFMMW